MSKKKKIGRILLIILFWLSGVLTSSVYSYCTMNYYAKGTNEHIERINESLGDISGRIKPLLPDRKGGHIRKPKEVSY